MKKILSIVTVIILCVAALAGCMTSPSRVERVEGVSDRHGNSICRCKEEEFSYHECGPHCIKDIEVDTKSSCYVIKIKYSDGHIESIKAPVNSTYIYYSDAGDK